MKAKAMTTRVSLTDNFLHKVTCPAGKDRAYFYDKRTPGLALCVTAAGGKTFYLIRRVHGRPRRSALGGRLVRLQHFAFVAEKSQPVGSAESCGWASLARCTQRSQTDRLGAAGSEQKIE